MREYFALYTEILETKAIVPENIYNMDETGRQLHPKACKSLMRAKHKPTFLRKNGDKAETISIIECICADGTVLNPTVIFKGQYIMQSWFEEIRNYDDFQPNVACSPNGWTDNGLALLWLHDFIRQTEGKQGYKLLLVEDHGSHLDYEFVMLCRQHDIELLNFIAHTTHLCQPLDVGCFSPHKNYLQEVSEWQKLNLRTISKCHF